MKCSKCGRVIRSVNYLNENDEPICNDCYAQYYTQCSQCGRAIPRGSRLCNECSEVAFKKVINSYGTKIDNRFKNRVGDDTSCKNDRYFGYEMEYSYTNGINARLSFKKQYDDRLIYNKSDSSLSGGGVEIVTIPMTRNNIIKLFTDMDFETFKKLSGRNTDTGAGVHIHVSRNTISPIDIIKLSLLFNGNGSFLYKKYIYYLVDRIKDIDENNLKYRRNHGSDGDNYFRVGTTPLSRIKDLDWVGSHGVALNLHNTNTIEFRLFNSTLDREQLISYLEFVEKAIEFCERNPINMISVPNFIGYLHLSCKTKWLKERLDNMYKYYCEVFEIKPVDYSSQKWYDKISKIKPDEFDKCIRILKQTNLRSLDFNRDWDWSYLSNIYDTYGSGTENKIVNVVCDNLKKKIIDELLAR